MSRPLLLDLYCGSGGCSRGYVDAGFDVVGVDIEPQRHYPYPFVQMDALECLRILLAGGPIRGIDGDYRLSEFSAISASPPCQDFSYLKHLAKEKRGDFITPTRALLKQTGLPYVIENVEGARNMLEYPAMLCGTMFGLGFEDEHGWVQLLRHRLFETNWGFHHLLKCKHGKPAVPGQMALDMEENLPRRRTICVAGDTPHDPALWRAEQRGMKPRVIGVYSHTPFNPAAETEERKARVVSVAAGHARDKAHEWRKARTCTVNGHTAETSNQDRTRGRGSVIRETFTVIRETFTVVQARQAMGIDWAMPMKGLSQAIPPAYCQFIGLALRGVIGK